MSQLHYRRAVARLALFLAVILAGMAAPAAAGQNLTAGQKAALQAVMQRHIESQLVEGVYLQVDLARGGLRRLHPVAAHPMILQLGEVFVLCTDFRDDAGKPVNIDFYLARKGPGHIVFQTVVDNRTPLEALVKQGRAQPLS